MGGNHPSWKGGKILNKGYVHVRAGDDPIAAQTVSSRGYVPEHRLVMARSLQRPLRRDEHVHHINGIKTDNRLENLELVVRAHGPGVALQCRVCGSRDLEPAVILATVASSATSTDKPQAGA
jgi:HNH endonuclease